MLLQHQVHALLEVHHIQCHHLAHRYRLLYLALAIGASTGQESICLTLMKIFDVFLVFVVDVATQDPYLACA